MSWAVPLTDVVITESDRRAVAECLQGGWLTMGPRTLHFETALQEWTGAPHAVTVSSATAALHLACRALDLGPGDEVVVPALTFIATANAPRYTGAQPVLCDVESPERPNLSAAAVERCLSPRTRAVIAVHFCGYPVDLGPLRELCEARGIALRRGRGPGDRRRARARAPGRHRRRARLPVLLLEEAAVRAARAAPC